MCIRAGEWLCIWVGVACNATRLLHLNPADSCQMHIIVHFIHHHCAAFHFTDALMHSSLEYKALPIRLRKLQLEPIWIATDRILFRSNAGSDSLKLQRSRLIRFQATSMDLRYLENKTPF